MLELFEELSMMGLAAETFDAVDGRSDFPELQADERIDQKKSLKWQQIQLTSAEVGCYLSHLRIIKEAHSAGLQHICILEDDILPEPFLADALKAIQALRSEHELIRLMGLKIHPRKVIQPLGDLAHLTRPAKGVCGAQGYVVNRSGMEKIIKKGSSIAEPIDKFYDHFWDIDLACFCVEPHAIWEREHTQTTIKKNSRDVVTKPLLARLRKHINKVRRSMKRRCYMATRSIHFFPNAAPPLPLGRTKRIH